MGNITCRYFYVDTSMGQLHGRLYENSGPMIICLHPVPYSGAYYETFCETLVASTHFSAISFDMLGYGQSSAINNPITIQDYAATVIEAMNTLVSEKLIDGDCSALGFHTGAAIANEMAILAPDLVKKVIFVTYPFFTAQKRQELIDSMSKSGVDENFEYLQSIWDFTISNRPENVPFKRALSNFNDQLRSSEKGWFGLQAMFNYLSEERLPLLNAPTLIINDISSLTEATRKASKMVKFGNYVELDNTKGAIFQLNVDQIISHINAFYQ